MRRARIATKKVQETQLRRKLKALLKQDSRLTEYESTLATLEILADRRLSERLLALSESIDQDVVAGRLLTMSDVFGKRSKRTGRRRDYTP